jgi:glyoxylase-like metal-dependent hydrolase (beta-lactamase superfamily II)
MNGGSRVGASAQGRPPEVADRVYRLGTRWLNFHLVAEDGEFTLIDAGYPGYWKHLAGAIEALGTSPEAIRGVILTHHHADHVGTAERVRSRSGADVFIGDGDAGSPVAVVPPMPTPASIGNARGGRAGSPSWPTAPRRAGPGTDRSRASRR